MSGALDPTLPPGSTATRPRKQAPPDRFIRVGDVSAMVGLGKTTIYKYVAEGHFPAPVALGGNRVAWLESEVLNWMRERVAARQT